MERENPATKRKTTLSWWAFGLAVVGLLLSITPLIILFGFLTYSIATIFSVCAFFTALIALFMAREQPRWIAALSIALSMIPLVIFLHVTSRG